MDHKFPNVNYIGNKQKLSKWIIENIPMENATVLDLFSGGSSVSYELKNAGYKVIANDVLYASYVISKALIENNKMTLDLFHLVEAINTDLSEIEKNKYTWLSERLYFPYEIEELSKLIHYSDQLQGYEKYLYLALLRRAMIRKLPYSRMNITWENIVKLRDEDYSYQKYGRKRAYHNKSFFEHMKTDLNNYNGAVFDNKYKNIASQLDALNAVKKYKNSVDIVYLDPPYPGTMNSYSEFYGAFDKIFNKKIEFLDLTNSKTFIKQFEKIIAECSKYLKYAVISLNSNTKPSVELILEMLAKYGSVELKTRKHNYQISGKKTKNLNLEILAIVDFK